MITPTLYTIINTSPVGVQHVALNNYFLIIHVTNSALNYYLHTLHVLSHYHIALQHAYLYIAITTHISHYYLFLKI